MPNQDDSKILATNFEVDDPNTLDGIVRAVPKTDEVPTIQLVYDTRGGSAGKIICVHCGHPNHNRGFVMRFSDGTGILVGNRCGAKLYGAQFHSLSKDFDARRTRKRLLRRRGSALAAWTTFSSWLESLPSHRAFTAFEQIKTRLNREVPELVAAVGRACKRDGGSIFRDVRVRDFKAEEHRDKIAEIAAAHGRRPPQSGPLFKTERSLVGVLGGQGFWRVDDLPLRRLDAAWKRLQSLVGRLEFQSMSNLALGNCLKDMGDLVDEIIGEVTRLRELTDAFEMRNLTLIERHAKETCSDVKVTSSIGALKIFRRGHDEVTISYPQEYEVPNIAPALIFKAALVGE